jgi:Ca2+-binding RTX toxin-like protein
MANFTTNTQVDFSELGIFFSAGSESVLQATSSLVQVITPTGSYQDYTGYFNYTYSGNYKYLSWPNSNLTGLTTYSSHWDKQFSITGLVIPGSNYQFYGDNNDIAGLKSFALRGNDSITGSNFNDVLWGYAGDDILDGRAGNDVLNGGDGNDSAYYNGAIASVTLNLWNTGSQSTVNAGFDTLISVENLLGSNYNDTLAGNAVANNINGAAGDDKLIGGAGNDVLIGGDGNDGLSGGDGNDILNGGNGIDWGQYWSTTGGVIVDMNITNPQNTLGAGIDTLISIENFNGSGFNDFLIGNALSNTLLGNAGSDTLAGGIGNDVLGGGTGKDTFLFNTVLSNNIDRINDFIPVDDTIKLENTIFTKLTNLGVINIAYFKVGIAADSNDYIIYNKASGTLLYDTDGNGAGLAVKIAVLGTHPTLTADDFMVV